MANFTVTIDVKQFQQFKTLLNDVINRLEKLDTALNEVSRTAKTIKFDFPGLDNFQRMLSVLGTTKGLKAGNFSGLPAIAASIADMSKSLRRVNTANYQAVIDGILRLSSLGIPTTVKNLRNLNQIVRPIQSIGEAVVSIREIGRLSARINLSGFQLFEDMLTRLVTLSSSIVVNRAGLRSLSSTLSRLGTLTPAIQAIIQMTTLAKRVDPMSFADLQLTLAALVRIGRDTSVNDLRKFSQVFKEMTGFMTSLTANLTRQGIINEYVQMMRSFEPLANGIERVVHFSKGITVPELANLRRNLVAIGTSLRVMAETLFTSNKGIFGIIGRRQAADVGQIEAMGKIMQALGNAITAMILGLRNVDRFKIDPANISRLIKPLKKAMSDLIGLVTGGLFRKPVPPSTLEALGKFMSGLSSVLRRVFRDMDSIPLGMNPVVQAQSIEQRMKVVLNLMNSLKKFKGAKLPDLGTVIGRLPRLFKTLSEISVDSGKSSQLEANTQAFRRMMDVLRKVDTRGVRFIGDLSRALRALATLKSVGDFTKGMDALRVVIGQFSQQKLDQSDFGVLEKIAKSVGKALNIIGKSNVTKEQIDAVSALAKVLSSFGKNTQPINVATELFDTRRIRSDGERVGENLGESVRRGVLSAGIQLFFLKMFTEIAADIIRLMNPITLFNAFRDGLESLVGFGRRLIQVFDDIGQKIRNVGQQLSQMGQNMMNIGQQLNRFGIQGLLGTTAVQAAADFDRLLDHVQTFGNLSAEELDRVRESAVQVGIQFPQSAAEGLEAGLNLIKAGLGAADVEFALPVVASLTALSESGDLDAISEGVIGIVNGFNLLRPGVSSEFENVSVVADILSSAADNSVASVESLMEALGNVAPAAAGFGLTLEETAAILATFENNGIKGAEAGTQLRTVLRSLQSDKARAELQSLGVSLTDAEGNFKDIVTIIGELDDAMNTPRTVRVLPGMSAEDQATLQAAQRAYASATRNIIVYQNELESTNITEEQRATRLAQYTEQQQNAAAAIARVTGNQQEADAILREIDRSQAENARTVLDLAGAYGQLGLSILIQEGDEGLLGLIDQMNAMPAAVDRARALLDNFSGDVQQLQGSLETLGIVAFQPLLEVYFRPFINLVRAMADGLLALNPEVLETIGLMVTLSSVFATIGGTGLIASGAVLRIGGGVIGLLGNLAAFHRIGLGLIGMFAGFTAGLAAIAVVILPLVAAVAAVAAGFTILRKVIRENIGNAGQVFQRFTARIQSTLGVLREVAGGFLGIVGALTGSGSEGSGISLEQVGQGVAFAFAGMERSLISFEGRMRFLLSSLAQLKDMFRSGFILDEGSLMSLQANPIVRAIFGMGGRTVDVNSVRLFMTNIRLAAQQFRTSLAQIGDALGEFGESVGNRVPIEQAFDTLRQRFQGSFGTLTASIVRMVGELLNIDFSAALTFLDQGNLTEGARAFVLTIIGKVRDAILGNRDIITNTLTTIFETFFVPGKFIGTVANFLGMEEVSNLFNEFSNIVTGAFKGIVDTIFNLLEGDSLETALTSAFGDGIVPLLNFVKELGRTVDSIVGIIANLISSVFFSGNEKGAGGTVVDFINGVLSGVTTLLSGLNDNILIPLKDAVANIDFDAIIGFFDNLLNGIKNFFSQITSGNFAGAAETLGTAIRSVFDTIKNIISGFLGLDGGGKPGTDKGDSGIGGILTTIASGIVRAIEGALVLAIGSIGTALGLNMDGFFAALKEIFAPVISGIESADPALILAGLVTGVANLVRNALQLGIDAIGTLTGLDTTGIVASIETSFQPILDVINTMFLGSGEEGGGSIFESARQIIENFSGAFAKIVSVFSGAGGAAQGINLLDALGNFLQIGANVGAALVAIPLRAVQTLLDRVASLDANTTLAVIGAISALLAIRTVQSMGGWTTFFNGLTGVPLNSIRSIRGMVSSLNQSMVGRAAAVFVIGDFLVNLIDNLSQLRGLNVEDILAGILQTFLDFGADIVSVLGFEDAANFIRGLGTVVDQLRIVMARAGALLRLQLEQIGIDTVTAIELAANNAKLALDQAAANLTGSGQEFTGIRTVFTNLLNDAITGGGADTNIAEGFQTLVMQSMVNGITIPESVRQEFILSARLRMTELIGVFNNELAENPGDPEATRKTVQDWFIFLTGLGQTDFAFDQLVQGGTAENITTFVQELSAMIVGKTQEEIAALGVNSEITTQLATSILQGFQTGVLSPEQAISLLEMGIFDLSDASRDALIAQINAYTAEIIATAGDSAQVAADENPPEVAVTPNVTVEEPVVTNPDVSELNRGVQVWLEGQENLDLRADADVTVTPAETAFDVTTIQTPEDVIALRTQVELTTGAFTLMKQEVSDTSTIIKDETTLMQSTMTGLQSSMTTTSLSFGIALGLMSAVFMPFNFMVNLGLTTMSTNVRAIIVEFQTLSTVTVESVPIITEQLVAAQGFFVNFANESISAMDRLILKLAEVKAQLDQIAGAVTAVNTTPVNPPRNSTGQGSRPGGRAKGGPVYPGQIYEILEGGFPEILQQGDRSYLLTPKPGRVIPMVNKPSSTAGMVGGSTVQVNNSITIPINAPEGVNAQQLANEVAQQLRTQLGRSMDDVKRIIVLHGGNG